MTLTRWKLMAGVLGLSLCGLAALAEPACRTVGYHQRKPNDKPVPLADTGAKSLPPPVNVPPPKLEPLPAPPPAVLPKADASPMVTGIPTPGPIPLPTPAVAPKLEATPAPLPTPASLPTPESRMPVTGEPKVIVGGVDEKAFTEMAKTHLKMPDLPKLEAKPAEPPKPTLPEPRPIPQPEINSPPPSPFVNAKPVEPLPAPTGSVPPVPAPTAPDLPPPPVPSRAIPTEKAPEPLITPPVSSIPPVSNAALAPVPPTTPTRTEIPPPTPVTSPPPETTKVSALVSTERKLNVQLHLGSGKPWFEVRDGEELVLKVVSDAVEVKAPAENGDAVSLLRASGHVVFRTLGGNGTCDELRVVPSTGEVLVSGKVSITSNWGKAETTATTDKMTFRLGSEK